MEISSHYYALIAMCRAVGLNKETSQQIAHASQFVDDAVVNLMTIKTENLDNIQHKVIQGKKSFFNMATCHSYFVIKTFNYSSMVNNTSAFHFVPSCHGDTFVRKLRCSRRNSPIIDKIMDEAVKEKDTIKLGMVLHIYADNFSHQGFSGILSKVNDIKDLRHKGKFMLDIKKSIFWLIDRLKLSKLVKFVDNLLPAYGHAQAFTLPDIPYMEWSYKYDSSDSFEGNMEDSKVDNRTRYRDAFKMIRSYLEKFLNNFPEYRDENISFNNFDEFYRILAMKTGDKRKIKKWQNFIIKNNFYNKKDPGYKYDKNLWLEEAFKNFNKKKFFEREVKDVILSDGFAGSSWYRYYLSVDWYKKRFFKVAEENGLAIPE
jgi:hypothetical protein